MLVHRGEALATTHQTRDHIVVVGIAFAALHVFVGIPDGKPHDVAAAWFLTAQNEQAAKSIQFIHRGDQRRCRSGKFLDLSDTNTIVRYASDHGDPGFRQEMGGEGDSTPSRPEGKRPQPYRARVAEAVRRGPLELTQFGIEKEDFDMHG
jgi:hypothetical protein